jgi:hypothetical protein
VGSFEILLTLLAQHPDEVMGPPPPGFLESLSALEYAMGTAIASLTGTVGLVWRWANQIRTEAAQGYEKRDQRLEQFLIQQIADSKDTVNALSGIDKTLDKVHDKLERMLHGGSQ